MKRRLFYLFVLVALALFSGTDTPWAQARPLDVPHTDMHQGGGFTNEAEQRIFRVVAVSDAGVDADGVHHRIALSGDGKFTANHVNASGTFVHFDQAPEGTPKPILASGNWKARKVLSYSGSLGAAGGIDAGILEVEVDLFPEGGSAITGILRIVCNIGFAGIMTGEPEGYKLTIPGPEGSSELTFVPLDPVLGLTHIGAPGAR